MNNDQAIRARKAELEREYAEIREKSAPLRAELDALCLEREAINKRVADKVAEIRETEGPRAITLPKEIAGLAKATGDRRMSDVAPRADAA